MFERIHCRDLSYTDRINWQRLQERYHRRKLRLSDRSEQNSASCCKEKEIDEPLLPPPYTGKTEKEDICYKLFNLKIKKEIGCF